MTATPAAASTSQIDAPLAPALTVNGERVQLGRVPAHTTVLDWLRSRGLTGAKEGCAEGECGACSVLVARAGAEAGSTQWTALNACLVPVFALDGQEVITTEGLGGPEGLHPVQREMADRGGSQCGYCTPGFVCSMAAEFYRSDRSCQTSTPAEGDAVPAATSLPHREPPAPGTLPTATNNHGLINGSRTESAITRAVPTDSASDPEHGPNGFDLHALSGNLCRCTGYRPIRDAAYALGHPATGDPLSTRLRAAPPAAMPTQVEIDGAEFIRATDLDTALRILTERPEAHIVAGSTDWGVEVNIRASRAPLVLAVDQIRQLREFDYGTDTVRIGAGLSLSEVERHLDGRIPLLAQLFPQFASRLIRNGATFGGNLGTGSPIGDTPPALLALDATLVLSSVRGDREVLLANYFTGYRKTVKADDELIRAVLIPLPLAHLTAFHKIAKRRFDDISSVAAGYAVSVDENHIITRARIGLGGVAATPLRALATEEALIGRPWNEKTITTAAEILATEGTPMDDHRASSKYRSAMLGQSLRRLYADNPRPNTTTPGERSATEGTR